MTPELKAYCNRIIWLNEGGNSGFDPRNLDIARACLAMEAELEAVKNELSDFHGGLPDDDALQGVQEMCKQLAAQQEEIARLKRVLAMMYEVSQFQANLHDDNCAEDDACVCKNAVVLNDAMRTPIPALTSAQSTQRESDSIGIDVFLTTERPVAEGDGMHEVQVTSDKLSVWGDAIWLDPEKCPPAERKALFALALPEKE